MVSVCGSDKHDGGSTPRRSYVTTISRPASETSTSPCPMEIPSVEERARVDNHETIQGEATRTGVSQEEQA